MTATSTFLCEIAYDDLLDVNIFIEITPDGNEIRIGINNEYGAYAPTDDNVNATTYDNWQGQKYSSGDAGFGITSVNMMLSNGGDIIAPIDADEVDWSQIYGVSTGCASDVDGDGIPNSLDTDSDGDDCYDANEAGFTDANEDGMVDGTGIDADGLVTGGDGYGTPEDTDNSDTADHLEYGVAECLPDTDNDGVYDPRDLDDDNDGILDTVECNCTDTNVKAPYSAGGFTLEGPAANQTGTNLFDAAGQHGWLSIDEPLGAGQRLVLSGAFLADVADAMGDQSIVIIGLKDGAWANTIGNAIPFGMEGGMMINIYRVSSTNFLMYGNNLATSTTTTQVIGTHLYNASQFLNYNAFIEVTSDGNNIRVGHALTNTHDATTETYADWGSSIKLESGDQGFGITELDVMVKSFPLSVDAGTTDANDIDWEQLTYYGPILLDTDKDGIFNHLDLDSDADGCPDAIEAAVPTVLKSSGGKRHRWYYRQHR